MLKTGNTQCISDAPCFFLVDELAQTYPDAKILLNERDVTAWLGSIEKTLRVSWEADRRWSSRPLR
jgi:Sulfotransferase domain